VAVVLIDAARTQCKPLKIQTRRHMTLAHMLGLTLVVAVNKMDAVGWSRPVFEDLSAKASQLARALGAELHAIVPISAKAGHNVVERGGTEGWHDGPTLLETLEAAPAIDRAARGPFRMPVQRVAVQAGRRLYQGRIESGVARIGDPVVVAPSLRASVVAAIETFDGPLDIAVAGQSVSIALADEIDVARGDLLAAPGVPLAQVLVADLCWLDEAAWRPGGRYLLKQGAATAQARIESILHVRDVAGLSEARPAEGLALNDIARVRLRAGTPLPADPFEDVPALGGFILIDAPTNQTAAAGVIRAAG
jgi:sulfate adenylyltransferase subunit 1